jgi:hypothetical protein
VGLAKADAIGRQLSIVHSRKRWPSQRRTRELRSVGCSGAFPLWSVDVVTKENKLLTFSDQHAQISVGEEFMRIEHNKLLRLIAVFLMSLTALITAKQVTAEIDALVSPNEADPLVTLNNAFRAEYTRAKTEALRKVIPLIIVEGINVILVRNGKRTEAQIQPPIYQSFKAVAHIPFAVFLMFDQADFGQLTEGGVAELRDYRRLIGNAQSSLGDRGFSDSQLQRQQKIIHDSLAFLHAAIENRQVQKTALGHRIIFAEGLWEKPRALDLLSTHLVDGSAGAAFFGEFMRMHRDLLSDAAKKLYSRHSVEV